jgi:glycosyltransferase involved in cell wall biosynthesis
MAGPHISFLIPCYNYGQYLPDCLNTIFAQEGSFDYEVVIIDDASTDDTPDLLKTITDPRVRVLYNEKNLGHARTMERLLREARGALVARIDPDDRYRPEFLRLTVPIFDQYPDVGLVYGDVALIDAEGRVTAQCADNQHGGRVFHGNELVPLLQRNFICAPSVIARRECWLDALPIPGHLAFNDWYFTVKIARLWNFYFIPHVIADYRVHGTNWHSRIARDGSEERSIRWLLDHVYETPEKDPAVEREKQAARGRIYASHSIDSGEKYFWNGNYASARRCYLRALREDARQVFRPQILRHTLATLVGRAPYEAFKRMAGRGQN